MNRNAQQQQQQQLQQQQQQPQQQFFSTEPIVIGKQQQQFCQVIRKLFLNDLKRIFILFVICRFFIENLFNDAVRIGAKNGDNF